MSLESKKQTEDGKRVLVYLPTRPIDPMREQPYLHCWDLIHHSEHAEHCCGGLS
jgi:hypothetical protein